MDTALLKHVPLFVSLPPSALADMAVSFQETRYSAGAVLFREGDYGDRFYIVLDGCIAIVKALGSDDERLLGRRGAGEFVGEMSLLSQDGLRTASVRVRVRRATRRACSTSGRPQRWQREGRSNSSRPKSHASPR